MRRHLPPRRCRVFGSRSTPASAQPSVRSTALASGRRPARGRGLRPAALLRQPGEPHRGRRRADGLRDRRRRPAHRERARRGPCHLPQHRACGKRSQSQADRRAGPGRPGFGGGRIVRRSAVRGCQLRCRLEPGRHPARARSGRGAERGCAGAQARRRFHLHRSDAGRRDRGYLVPPADLRSHPSRQSRQLRLLSRSADDAWDGRGADRRSEPATAQSLCSGGQGSGRAARRVIDRRCLRGPDARRAGPLGARRGCGQADLGHHAFPQAGLAGRLAASDKGAMQATCTDLWQRLADYEIGPDDAAFTFAQRLARENRWSAGFAAKLRKRASRPRSSTGCAMLVIPNLQIGASTAQIRDTQAAKGWILPKRRFTSQV